MGTLMHPVGPKAGLVYWLRRASVLIVVALLVAGVWWVAASIGGAIGTDKAVADPGSAPAATPTASVTPSPTGPQPCSFASLSVVGYQSLKVTAKQVFATTITNGGAAACVLTIAPSTYSLTVVSGADTIWTTAHCDKWIPATTVTLEPGAKHEFSVNWPLVRSKANCGTSKTALKPGTYVATATLTQGSWSTTARQVMVLTKA